VSDFPQLTIPPSAPDPTIQNTVALLRAQLASSQNTVNSLVAERDTAIKTRDDALLVLRTIKNAYPSNFAVGTIPNRFVFHQNKTMRCTSNSAGWTDFINLD